jgi:hypothetical protein
MGRVRSIRENTLKQLSAVTSVPTITLRRALAHPERMSIETLLKIRAYIEHPASLEGFIFAVQLRHALKRELEVDTEMHTANYIAESYGGEEYIAQRRVHSAHNKHNKRSSHRTV